MLLMVVGLDFWVVFFLSLFFSVLKLNPRLPSPSTDTVFIIVSHFSLHFADIFLELTEHVGQTGSRYFRGFLSFLNYFLFSYFLQVIYHTQLLYLILIFGSYDSLNV